MLPKTPIPALLYSNPLHQPSKKITPPPPTQTVAARTVYHQMQAAIRPLLADIQTQEQLSILLERVDGLQ